MVQCTYHLLNKLLQLNVALISGVLIWRGFFASLMIKMKVKYLLVLVLIVPMVVVGSFYFYWYVQSGINEKVVRESRQKIPGRDEVQSDSEPLLEPPIELSVNFDPSENAGKFSVEGVDGSSGQIKLNYIFPRVKAGESISPVITCPIWDSKVFDLGAKAPRYVTPEKLMQIIVETPKTQMILSGKCSDNSCYLMDKECELYINQPLQDAKK